VASSGYATSAPIASPAGVVTVGMVRALSSRRAASGTSSHCASRCAAAGFSPNAATGLKPGGRSSLSWAKRYTAESVKRCRRTLSGPKARPVAPFVVRSAEAHARTSLTRIPSSGRSAPKCCVARRRNPSHAASQAVVTVPARFRATR
jgi:hypothetical protein